jgi:hypothetical protein
VRASAAPKTRRSQYLSETHQPRRQHKQTGTPYDVGPCLPLRVGVLRSRSSCG